MDARTARRFHDLVEPIGLIPYRHEGAHDGLVALGLSSYWDGYFAARAAPLGRPPAEVVDAIFYSFAPGEVARHVPQVWDRVAPEAARQARVAGCVGVLRSALGDRATTPSTVRAADLLVRAATGAPVAGRPLYAGLRGVPVPAEPVERLWHAADLLREHRGDGHVAALLTCGVGGTEAHVLWAAGEGTAPRTFGRVHHLPARYLDAVIGGLRERGVLDEDEGLTDAGRALRERVERLTDELACPPYAVLTGAERAELLGLLPPIAAAVDRAR
ncbi:SCO6745 family protein [Nocardioides litoris]|uniref:SCO6745 family protein n=1 Tax=Nocardioides litoris TaxID=1926648 RepID=UPI0011233E74|nr:MarR family transcriptional regulator [Nocardioides litoris]